MWVPNSAAFHIHYSVMIGSIKFINRRGIYGEMVDGEV
jgi:hypothetical protein